LTTTGRAPRGRSPQRLKRAAPFAYLGMAMLVSVLVLPSALRPPPDPTTESGALSPDAPPDQNNPEQLLQSLQQAAGGGAGATPGGTTTTLPVPTTVLGVPTTRPGAKAGSGYCFGRPPRQIQSVYAGPCVPAFNGANGGATSKNVFANEIRLGFTNLGAPAKGRVPDGPTENESAGTRTFRVLGQYFNQRYETYGRRVAFFGDGDPASASAADQQAYAAMLANDPAWQLFGIYSTSQSACENFVQYGLVATCDPLAHKEYLDNRPGLFSFPMDLNQLAGLGAEYACKTLKDKVARFGGPDVSTRPRKFGFVTYRNTQGGLPGKDFSDAFRRECDGVADVVELSSQTDANQASAAMARFKTDGITTIIFSNVVGNMVLLMNAASSAVYTPEWVLLGSFSIDNNTIATALPKEQSAHMFGLTSQEWPQAPATTECQQAYHSIDPDNDPDTSACFVHWRLLVMFFNAIQGAGPNLTPASYQKALFDLGHRDGPTVWAIGGGFGPDDYSYTDSVAEVWYDASAVDPTLGAPGAYRFTHDGTRYKRGELTGDDSQIQRSGSAQAPSS
jgi:hypothetical protein